MKRSEPKRREQVSVPTHVSKNILNDLGLSPEQSAALKIKAGLLDGILAEVQRRKYSPTEVTEILNDYQPQVSNLLRGKISAFSIEKLLRYADALHLKPVLTLRPTSVTRMPETSKRPRRRIA